MSDMFDFSHFPIIHTKRLTLRQLVPDDVDAVIALYGNPQVLEFLSDPPVDTHDKAIALIHFFNHLFNKGESINWAVTITESQEFIGIGGNHEWNKQDRKIDIGYSLIPQYWGFGYATETAQAIIRWSFKHLNLHRVQADCTDGNTGSENVLLKCGMTFEGIWRESCFEQGRFVDIKQFGILRREITLED